MAKIPLAIKVMFGILTLFLISFPTIFLPPDSSDGSVAQTTTSATVLGLVDGFIIFGSFTVGVITSIINTMKWLGRGGPYFWLSVTVFFIYAGSLGYILLSGYIVAP